MRLSKWNSAGGFCVMGIEFNGLELEDGRSYVMAFDGDLSLDESEYVYSEIELTRHGDEEEGAYRTETNTLSSRTRRACSARYRRIYIDCFSELEIDESLFRVDPAHTSISLALTLSSKSSAPHSIPVGAVGVFGRFPSDFLVEKPGKTGQLDICFACGLGSVDMTAS